MAQLSIIVTAYNIARYIDQCLKSIAGQTLSSIEVLVVDDGSTDGTAERIADFAARDSRFIPVLLIENSAGGVATAANAGLDRATGEWVGFVDGDDYVEPTMFESLLAAATAYETDLAMCQYREVSEDGVESRAPADARRWTTLEGGPHHLDVTAKKRFLRFISVPWRKLYRRSLLESNGIRFPVGDYFYEDNPFHWFSIISARSIAVVPHVLCYHRVGQPGQTMAAADIKLFEIFRHHDTIRDWLAERELLGDFAPSLLEWVISQVEWISRRIPKELRRELFSTLRPIFAEYPPEVVGQALHDGRKGEYAQQFTAALVEGSLSKFTRAMERQPDTENYLVLGLYHLRHSGVRHTLSLTHQTVRNRFGTSAVGRFLAKRNAATGTPAAIQTDVMFGLMVLQQRIDDLEAKLDEIKVLGVENGPPPNGPRLPTPSNGVLGQPYGG